MRFRFALDLLNSALSNQPFTQELTRMEVEDNSSEKNMEKVGYQRIGLRGQNRLVDYLLSESDDDKLFALEQFEYLHSHHNQTYDSAYPAIRIAIKKTKNTEIERRLSSERV